MVKRRTPTPNASEEARIEAFAAAADGGKYSALNPDAPRNYKKINVPFNEYEFQQLEEAAKRAGRSKLNFIRWAISEAGKE